ncbi:MAG TPA: ABC transporter permease subunit [Gemmatales bacterium]|nr:ABC transporter permease subunit [Gemmatales bacterium]
MSLTLFLKILRDLRWPLLGAAFLLTLFEGFWVKITDRFTNEVIPAILKKIPYNDLFQILFEGSGKLFQAILGGESVNLSKTSDLLSVGYVHPLPQTILMIWALGRGASAISGEIERGTMELLVSQPIPRWKIITTNFMVDLVTIPTLAFCMLLGTYLGTILVPLPNIDLVPYLRGVLLAIAFAFAMSGITYAISSMGRSRWRVLAWTFGIILAMSILNLLGQLWDTLGPWRPIAIHYYFQPQYAILKNQWTLPVAGLQVNALAVMLGVAGLGYAFALWRFSQRDLPAPL